MPDSPVAAASVLSCLVDPSLPFSFQNWNQLDFPPSDYIFSNSEVLPIDLYVLFLRGMIHLSNISVARCVIPARYFNAAATTRPEIVPLFRSSRDGLRFVLRAYDDVLTDDDEE